jgi:hypothetical protein
LAGGCAGSTVASNVASRLVKRWSMSAARTAWSGWMRRIVVGRDRATRLAVAGAETPAALVAGGYGSPADDAALAGAAASEGRS